MPHRILLADDSLTIQKVVELTFSDAEFEIRAVGNGDDAVRALDEFRPDLVLADAFMPGLTGYEVCERVKALGGTPPIPVVLLAGTFEPFDRARAERSGADSIVTKPFDSHALASLVRDLVEKARHLAPTLSIPAVGESPTPRWDEPTDPDVPVLRPAPAPAPTPAPAPAPAPTPFAVESPFPADPGSGEGENALYETAAIPVGALLATAAPTAPELADPFGDVPAPPSEAPGVPATTLPLQLDAHFEREGEGEKDGEAGGPREKDGDRADAITGPIVLEDRAAEPRGNDPFGPPPVLEPQDEFLVEPAGVQPRDIEADLEAFESSGKGRTRPEVWDQAEAMGLSGPREESTWPEEPGLAEVESPGAPAAEAAEAVREAEPAPHEAEHQLAPDAGAFDLAEAEGVQHRDLEALAAEARRTDLNELIPPRVPSPVEPSLAGPVSLSEADVDRIARRVAELVGEASLRDVAWEVVPEIAERVVRQRIRELEGE